MSEPTREQLQTLQNAFEAWPAPWEEEDTEVVRPALRALLDAYEERGREVERLRARLTFLDGVDESEASGWCGEHPRRFAVDAREGDAGTYDECQKCRAEKAEAEIERQEKLIDYLERYGPKPLNERLERAEAEVERLKANRGPGNIAEALDVAQDDLRRLEIQQRENLNEYIEAAHDLSVKLEQAEAEVERLRAENERLKELVVQSQDEGTADALALRGALQDLVAAEHGYVEESGMTLDDAISDAVDAALKVLAVAQPEEERRG